jgi:putative exporter of polyketide antibiotics
MFRFPFASNRWFRLLLSLMAAAVMIKMLLQPDKNEKMQYLILVVAGAVFIRGIYLFFRSSDKQE